MKLTKYAHACVALEKDGTTIVIDPGVFTPDVEKIIADAEAVLITHEHADHIDKDKLEAELKKRSELMVYGPEAVIESLGSASEQMHAVHEGDKLTIGSFTINVLGELHEPIHRDLKPVQNACYLLDGTVFHPGDSFTQPGTPINVLLLPTSGPWLKLAEAADYVRAVKPSRIIEIHEQVNSEIGSQLANNTLGENGLTGIKLEQLAHGESTEI